MATSDAVCASNGGLMAPSSEPEVLYLHIKAVKRLRSLLENLWRTMSSLAFEQEIKKSL